MRARAAAPDVRSVRTSAEMGTISPELERT